jgi:hypothetical protein
MKKTQGKDRRIGRSKAQGETASVGIWKKVVEKSQTSRSVNCVNIGVRVNIISSNILKVRSMAFGYMLFSKKRWPKRLF